MQEVFLKVASGELDSLEAGPPPWQQTGGSGRRLRISGRVQVEGSYYNGDSLGETDVGPGFEVLQFWGYGILGPFLPALLVIQEPQYKQSAKP